VRDGGILPIDNTTPLELRALKHRSNSPLLDKANKSVFDTRLHFAAMVNSSNDPIIREGLTGRILCRNRAATRVFGYQARHLYLCLRFNRPELDGHWEDSIFTDASVERRRTGRRECSASRTNREEQCGPGMDGVRGVDRSVLKIVACVIDCHEQHQETAENINRVDPIVATRVRIRVVVESL